MDLVTTFNAVEACWWFLSAMFVAVLGHRVRGLTVGLRITLCPLLLAFGASDVIEIFTGAWWRPLGLMVLKGACLLGIIAVALIVLRSRRR